MARQVVSYQSALAIAMLCWCGGAIVLISRGHFGFKLQACAKPYSTKNPPTLTFIMLRMVLVAYARQLWVIRPRVDPMPNARNKTCTVSGCPLNTAATSAVILPILLVLLYECSCVHSCIPQVPVISLQRNFSGDPCTLVVLIYCFRNALQTLPSQYVICTGALAECQVQCSQSHWHIS